MSKKLYVGNLNFKATADEIRQLFGTYGDVQDVSIVTDRYSGRSRGFAFVEMAAEDGANKAREALNGKPFQERNLTVDWARPEGQGGTGGGGRREREGSGGGSSWGKKPFRR